MKRTVSILIISILIRSTATAENQLENALNHSFRFSPSILYFWQEHNATVSPGDFQDPDFFFFSPFKIVELDEYFIARSRIHTKGITYFWWIPPETTTEFQIELSRYSQVYRGENAELSYNTKEINNRLDLLSSLSLEYNVLDNKYNRSEPFGLFLMALGFGGLSGWIFSSMDTWEDPDSAAILGSIGMTYSGLYLYGAILISVNNLKSKKQMDRILLQIEGIWNP